MTSTGRGLHTLLIDRAARVPRRRGTLAWLPLLAMLLLAAGCADEAERISGHLERGADYVADGKDDEAIIEFKNVLQLDPESAPAHEALSLAYLRQSKPREAYWEMSETVRVDPSNVEARLRYGTISAAIGEFDLAMEQADAVLASEPDNPRGLTLRAQARENRDDAEGAGDDYLAAVAAAPEAPAFRFLLGGYHERQKDFDAAEAAYRELVEVEPSYLAISTLTRTLLRDTSRTEEIDARLEQAIEAAATAPTKGIEREPGVEDTGTTSLLHNVLREEAIVGAHTLKALVLRDRGDFDGAIATLEAGVQRSEKKVDLIYQMAQFYRLEGRPEDEDRMIRRATTEVPDNSGAQLVLSAYLGTQGDLDGALEAARAAVAADSESEPAQLRVAELLIDLGFQSGEESQIREGRAIVDGILESKPDSPEANFVKAKIELAEEDIESAKGSLETTLQARPDWAQARYVLGSALAASGEIARARVELEAAVEADGNLLDARKLLTQVYARLGEHEFVIDNGRAYLRARPSDMAMRILVGQSLIRVGRTEDAYAEIESVPEEQWDAAAYFASGRLDLVYQREAEGRRKLERANELAPGNPQVLRTLYALDVRAKKPEAALARIEAAVEAKPEDSELLELLAEVQLSSGDAEAARSRLESAIATDPRNVTAQLRLAELVGRSGDAAGMVTVLEKAAQAVPESSDVQYQLATAYDRAGRKQDAMAAYEKTIALNPDTALAKNNLAYMIAEEGGDLDRALELAQQAKEALPEDGNASDTLGWVLLKRGLPSAAIGYLQEASERFPKEAYEIQGVVRNHLAQAYEANDEADNAIRESRASVDAFERLKAAAAERGLEASTPAWFDEAQARIERLQGAS